MHTFVGEIIFLTFVPGSKPGPIAFKINALPINNVPDFLIKNFMKCIFSYGFKHIKFRAQYFETNVKLLYFIEE